MRSGADEFYVGYLRPVPRMVARRVRAAVLCLGVSAAAGAALLARSQGDAGDAVWESAPAEITGLFVAEPYPVLVVGEGSERRTAVLVGAGKCGAFEPSGYCGLLGGSGGDARARREAMGLFDGKVVRAHGTRLQRGGRTVMELDEGDRAVVIAADQRASAPGPMSAHPVRLTGTIVDPKCYLGAMRPGEGKTHRGCAVRCIAGGIPPMLLVRDGDSVRGLLLAGAVEEPLNDAVLPFVGDEVEVTGRVGWAGCDIQLMAVDPGGIRRR